MRESEYHKKIVWIACKNVDKWVVYLPILMVVTSLKGVKMLT